MTKNRNFRVRIDVLLSAMLLAWAVTCALPANAAPLGQAGTGTITGQVLGLDDVPLANVRLAAFAQGPTVPDRTRLAEIVTDTQGRYSVQVPEGMVWVEFQTQDINGQTFWGYSNLPVNVTAGQTVSGQDFRVAIGVVSRPPSTGPFPGMPTTGAGPDLWLPVAGGLGLLVFVAGLVQRRPSPR